MKICNRGIKNSKHIGLTNSRQHHPTTRGDISVLKSATQRLERQSLPLHFSVMLPFSSAKERYDLSE